VGLVFAHCDLGQPFCFGAHGGQVQFAGGGVDRRLGRGVTAGRGGLGGHGTGTHVGQRSVGAARGRAAALAVRLAVSGVQRPHTASRRRRRPRGPRGTSTCTARPVLRCTAVRVRPIGRRITVRTSFADIEQDFLRCTADIVYCTVTTVDAQCRPRSRVMHPIFEVVDGEPLGWAVTDRSPVKTRHPAANPHVSCAYWSPPQNTVYLDCGPPGSMTSPASGMSGTCSGCPAAAGLGGNVRL
jgi:hypothetical protein